MDLVRKIENRSARVGVVGLGYVGLPLIIEFVKQGFSVTGFDIDQDKVDFLKAGKTYIKHIDIAPLTSKGKRAGGRGLVVGGACVREACGVRARRPCLRGGGRGEHPGALVGADHGSVPTPAAGPHVARQPGSRDRRRAQEGEGAALLGAHLR